MKKKKTTNWKDTSAYIDSALAKKKKHLLKPKKENKKEKDPKIIQCPTCDQIITLHDPIKKSFTLNCPSCNHPINISKKKKQVTKPKRKPFLTIKIPNINLKKIIQNNLVELILIAIGLIYLIQPTMTNLKISFTLIFIATILLFLMTGEQPDSFTKKKVTTAKPFFKRRLHTPTIIKKIRSVKQKIGEIPLSNRISIVLIFWTLLLFVITADLEIYFILIFIGVLITRELTDLYTSKTYKTRLNAYIVIFLFTYIILISQKIMEILAT